MLVSNIGSVEKNNTYLKLISSGHFFLVYIIELYVTYFVAGECIKISDILYVHKLIHGTIVSLSINLKIHELSLKNYLTKQASFC